MVQDVLADARRARAVKPDARKVGWIRRQEEVAVTRRHKRQNHHGIHPHVDRHRHHDRDCRALRIHELRREEGEHRICPRIGLHRGAEELLEERDMVHKVGIRHPRDAVDGDERDNARAEHLRIADILCLHFAGNEDHSAHEQHDHLNDHNHRDGLRRRSLLCRKFRQEFGEVAEHGNRDDAGEENIHRTVVFLRQLLVEQRLGVAVDILLVLRVADELLEALVVLKILAAAIAPQRRKKDTAERRRDRHGEYLEHRKLMPRR